MQYGPRAALIAESFTTRLRYGGAGIGDQLASVVAGGPAPLLADWMLHTFDSTPGAGSRDRSRVPGEGRRWRLLMR